ncbi:putative G-protein coupled receptor 19 [Lampetra fluviatilis]
MESQVPPLLDLSGPSSSPCGAASTAASTAAASADLPAELRPAEAVVLCLLLSASWLASVAGNALVCLVIHRSRRTQSTTNYFVVSVACSDLLLAGTAAPLAALQVAMSGRWVAGDGVCRVARLALYLAPAAQIYVLLSICLDRFYTIVYPLSFKVSREKAKRMIGASWTLTAVLALPALYFYRAREGWPVSCASYLPYTWEGLLYGCLLLLLAFVLPCVFMVLFYLKIVKYIWRIGSNGRTVQRTMNSVPRTKVKTIKMFLILNAVFLTSWLPFFALQVWHPGEDERAGSASTFLVVSALALSCSAAKPTLYWVYNSNFRRGVKETFCMAPMKCYRSNAYTITTSSRIAKKNHVGIVDLPAPNKTVTKDTVYETFDRDAKEKKLAWPINTNSPNTFV